MPNQHVPWRGLDAGWQVPQVLDKAFAAAPKVSIAFGRRRLLSDRCSREQSPDALCPSVCYRCRAVVLAGSLRAAVTGRCCPGCNRAKVPSRPESASGMRGIRTPFSGEADGPLCVDSPRFLVHAVPAGGGPDPRWVRLRARALLPPRRLTRLTQPPILMSTTGGFHGNRCACTS